MSTADPQFIIVDNVDSSIEYTGPWFSSAGTENYLAMYGPPSNQGTLHGTNASASLSFAFNGSQIRVLGTNNIGNASGVSDSAWWWQCFIDGSRIGISTPFPSPGNNWLFCNHGSLGDGPHVLTVNATFLNNQTVWFDNIQYVPSTSVPLDQATIMVDYLDPQIHYGSGWETLGSSAKMTNVSGSTVSFNFVGTAVSWYGYIPQEYSISPSSGTYSIDGETPVNFALQGLPSNTTPTNYNQKFFETGQLSPTSHTLQVVYQGNNSTPLTITNLIIIKNGTVSTSASSTPTAGSGSSTSTSGKSVTPVGAIVGGTIGGVAFVLLFVLGFFIRRRRKRAAQEQASISTPNPFESTGYPSSSSISPHQPSGGISYSQVPQPASPVLFGKGQVYRRQRPSISNTDGSQSVEPWNTSPGAVLPQQPALTRAKPSPSSPTPGTSSPRPLPLPSNTEREAEAQGTPRPQIQGGVLLHADSGIRMAASTVEEVPPEYTAD